MRKTSRFKDGKKHDYWSVAENARFGKALDMFYGGERDERTLSIVKGTWYNDES